MQSTNNILLIRPSNFVFNTQTADSNAFQNAITATNEEIQKNVFNEFEAFEKTLKSKGVNVCIVDDTVIPQKPDAIFPNNWVSFHANGTVILYPMFAPNRRLERRLDIIELLKKDYEVTNIIDLSINEKDNIFLEGTGSIVFDHNNKIAYACLSPRTNKNLFLDVCKQLTYQPIYFTANDQIGKEIYHTNVMMCVGETFVVICLDSITNVEEKQKVADSIFQNNKELIAISFEQMNQFAGNMLELKTSDNNKILVLSKSSFDSLTKQQKQKLQKHCELVHLNIKTIETIGGGSARCMIAEIFLKKNRY